jgi:hypothetical protein
MNVRFLQKKWLNGLRCKSNEPSGEGKFVLKPTGFVLSKKGLNDAFVPQFYWDFSTQIL